jgi:hypothetical protein
VDAGIQGYPTWIINGDRHDRVMTMAELAGKSGFKAPTPVAN